MLCEDCLMEACSPLRACDPWAVHSAKTFERHTDVPELLTPLQEAILQTLAAHGPMAPEDLRQRLGARCSLPELEREFAALRHMEKVRGEKRETRVLWRLW